MITISKNNKHCSSMPFSYYKDESILITREAYFEEDEGFYWNDDPILVEIETLYPERISDLPKGFGFFMDEPIKGSLFSLCGFTCRKEVLILNLDSRYTHHSWKTTTYNPRIILKRLTTLLDAEFTQIGSSIDEDDIELIFERNKESYLTIEDFILDAITKLKKAEQLAVWELTGFKWKADYYANESLFSKEIIAPLLRNMGFKKIVYHHGHREYGKDFIFSEMDKFGNYVHYAMQVKAGDVNGKVNGQIDELIGQIDDAFKIPFKRENEPDYYISGFYIVISGKFTENAIEKIRNKIPKEYLGSVQILDKDRVIELLASYCS